MTDQLTLDVIDRPNGGVVRARRRLRALRRDPPPGMRALIPLATGRFVPRIRPSVTPRRLAVRGELVRAAFSEPWKGWTGYLGGLAVQSSARNTTSCSAWWTYADARDYAFRHGAHAAAMRRDRAHQNPRTEWFSRVRPLAERGTLDGAAPFAEVLGRRVVAGG